MEGSHVRSPSEGPRPEGQATMRVATVSILILPVIVSVQEALARRSPSTAARREPYPERPASLCSGPGLAR
jgi:hypothetical protein